MMRRHHLPLAIVAVLAVATPCAAELRVPLSSYDDDPFVEMPEVEKIVSSAFDRGADERPILSNSRIKFEDEVVIYREDPGTGEFLPFANNPWPCAPDPESSGFCLSPGSTDQGDFKYRHEPRFPLHLIERGPDGRPLRDANGLQIWKPRDLHLGFTTAFEAAHAARLAVEEWAGRPLRWGSGRSGTPQDDDLLLINGHAFIDFNAFFSPSARMLFFGVVPYRFPQPGAAVQVFEVATSWEIAAHEAGHALHAALKPNRDIFDPGYRTWTESFGDQVAMLASLRDPERVRALLKETGGNLDGSNAVTRLAEGFGVLVGDNVPLRDAFNDKTVSTTSPEEHDRSGVLTGAAYRLLVVVHAAIVARSSARPGAIEEARDILGTFLARANDYVPENVMTLEDVARGYLKVDKEFFNRRYRTFLVAEFMRRGLFDARSLNEWLAHEAAVPHLRLPPAATDEDVEALVQSSLDELAIAPEFGLVLQSIVRDGGRGQTIVRVGLTLGRGPGGLPLDNHGVLVFRANGTLADYHPPLPAETFASVPALVARAGELGLAGHGVPLSIARRPDGRVTVEARVMRGHGMKPYLEAFTLESPHGERREIIPSAYGGAAKAALLEDAGIVLSAEQLTE